MMKKAKTTMIMLRAMRTLVPVSHPQKPTALISGAAMRMPADAISLGWRNWSGVMALPPAFRPSWTMPPISALIRPDQFSSSQTKKPTVMSCMISRLIGLSRRVRALRRCAQVRPITARVIRTNITSGRIAWTAASPMAM